MPNLEVNFETLVNAFVFLDKNKDDYVSRNEMVDAINETTSGEQSSCLVQIKLLELERQLLDATSECSILRSALEVSNAEKAQLEQEKTQLEQGKTQLEQDLAESRATSDELNRQLADLLPLPEDEGIIREVVKCLVFGGLDELMISLRLVSSIESGSRTTWDVLRFAIGFVLGGASILVHSSNHSNIKRTK